MEAVERSEQMRRLLERREREGLSYRELAASEPGVTVNQLYWWRRKLFGRSPLAPPPREKAAGFVELVESRRKPHSRIEIVLRGERRIVIGGELDETLLVRVVRALERC